MLKRCCCLLLILSLFCALAACGSEENIDASAETVVESVAAINDKQSLSITAVPDNLFGSCSDSLYTNELLALQFELPEGWYFYGSSTLAELCGVLLGEEEYPSQEQFISALKTNGVTYDMVARESEGADMVVVSFPHPGKLYGEAMTEQQYADKLMETYSTRLSGIDSGVAELQMDTINIAGTEHPCLQFLSSENGSTLHKTVACIQTGEFMATLTASSLYEGDDVSILDDFDYYEAVSVETGENTDE